MMYGKPHVTICSIVQETPSWAVNSGSFANAVNIEHPAIGRRPAISLDPDSDLLDLPVTVAVDVNGNSVHEAGPREWKQKIAELVEIR